MLEEVYSASLNSEGSAQRENEKYLESLSAKIEQFKNQASRLASITFDSEWIKNLVDFGTDAVKVIGTLIDKFGLLKTGFVAVAAVLGAKNGFKAVKNNMFGIQPMLNSVKSLFEKIPTVSADVSRIMNAYKGTIGEISATDMRELMKDSNFTTFANSGAYTKDSEVSDVLAGYKQYQIDNGQYTRPITQKLKGFASGVVSSALTGIAVGAVMQVVQMGVEAIYHQFSSKYKIEQGEKAQQKVQSAIDEVTQKQEKLNEVQEEYNKLRKGVDINGGKITNVDLSTEDFDRFLEINQELAELFPSLVTGITSEGQAIVDLGNNAEKANEQLEKTMALERERAATEAREQAPDIIKGVVASNKSLKDDLNEFNLAMEEYRNLPDAEHILAETNMFDHTKGIQTNSEAFHEIVQSAITSAGFDDLFNAQGLDFILKDTAELTTDQLVALRNTIVAEYQKAVSSQSGSEAQMQQNWIDSLLPTIRTELAAEDDFEVLGDELQAQFNTMFHNISFEKAYEAYEKSGTDASFDRYLIDSFWGRFAQALEYNRVDEETLSKLLSFDSSLFDNQEMDHVNDKIDELLDYMFGTDPGNSERAEFKHVVKVALGYEFVDDEGEYQSIYNQYLENVMRSLDFTHEKDYTVGGFGSTGTDSVFDLDTLLNGDGVSDPLTARDFETLDNWLKEDSENTLENIKTYAELLDLLYQIRHKTAQTINDGTIAEIFAHESFDDDTSKYTDKLDKLSESISNMISGDFDNSALMELIKTFPQLASETDNLESAINGLKADNFVKFMETLKQYGDDEHLSESEQAAWNNYMNIAALAYGGDMEVSKKQAASARNKIHSYDNEAAEEFLSTYANLWDTEEGREVLLRLSVDPTLADADLSQWIDAANKQKVVVEVNADLTQLEKDLVTLGHKRSMQEYRMNTLAAAGFSPTEADYKVTADIAQQFIDVYNAQLDTIADEIATGIITAEDGENKADEIRTKIATERQTKTDSLRSADLVNYNELQFKLESIQAEANKLQTRMDTISTEGNNVDAQYYRNLIANSESQIKVLQAQYEDRLRIMEQYNGYTPEQLARNEKYQEDRDALQSIEDAMNNITTSQLEWNDAIAQIPLNALAQRLTETEAAQARVQDEISAKSDRNIKVQASDYQKLIRLGNRQIKNLEAQNKELRAQQKEVKYGQQKWNELQNQIDSNDASIRSAMASNYEYEQNIRTLLLNQAGQLSDSISNALSEIGTLTGVSDETIQGLTLGFSDLVANGTDIENLFYRTADGVKVNIRELQNLAETENTVVTNEYAARIERARKELQRMQEVDADTSAIDAQKEAIADLERQQAQYFALYEEQMKKFNAHGMIEIADSTENQGAGYDKAVQYMKDAKEMWDKGLIGTDDFQKRAAYFDQWGFEDYETFKENYDKFNKYLDDESGQGIVKFMKDLEKNGLATMTTLEDGSEALKMNFTDMADAARTMGMGEEFFKDMFGKAEEYGGIGAFVSSTQEWVLKTQDLKTQLTEAKLKYADLIAAGADDETLQKQQEVVDGIKAQLSDLDVAYDNFQDGQQESYVAGLSNIEKLAAYYSKAYKEALESGDADGANAFKNAIEELSNKYGVKIDIETGEVDQTTINELRKSLGVGSWDMPIDIGMDATDPGFQAFTTGFERVKEVAESGEIQDLLDALSGYSSEELSQIEFGNGAYDIEGLEAQEDALEGIAKAAGLSTDQAKQLLSILKAAGVIDIDPDIKVDEDEIEEFKEALNLGEDSTFKITADISEEGITEFKSAMATIPEGVSTTISATVANEDDVTDFMDALESVPDNTPVTLDLDVQNAEQLDAVQQKVSELNSGGKNITVNAILTTTGKTDSSVQVGANTSAAHKAVNNLISSINKEHATIQIGANTSRAHRAANSLISGVNSSSATITVNAKTHDIVSNISSTLSKRTFWINVKANVTGLPQGGKATGTMSTAKAGGSFYNVLNYKDAYAGGTIGDPTIHGDQEALVNEVGVESIVRSGRWMLMPGGNAPHVENLKDGDIVFNASQTKMLLEGRSAAGRGRVIGSVRAYAKGTLSQNALAPAYATGGTFTWTGLKAGAANTKAVNNNTAAQNSAAKAAEDTTETIDWVERRLKYFGDIVNRISTSISDYVTSAFKKRQLNAQSSAIEDQIEAQRRAYDTYLAKANSIALDETYKRRVREGEYLIEDIDNEDLSKLIGDYRTWYDLAVESNDAVQELRNTQLQLYEDFVNVPIDDAEKKIDSLGKKLEWLQGRIDLSGTKGSTLKNYATVLKNDTINANAQVDAAKAEYDAAIAQRDKLLAAKGFTGANAISNANDTYVRALQPGGNFYEAWKNRDAAKAMYEANPNDAAVKKHYEWAEYIAGIADKQKAEFEAILSAQYKAIDALDKWRATSAIDISEENKNKTEVLNSLGKETYKYSNALLSRTLENLKAQNEANKKAYEEVLQYQADASAEYTKATRDLRGKGYDSYIDSHEVINTIGITDRNMLAYIERYNMALQNLNTVTTTCENAASSFHNSQIELAEAMTTAAQTAQDNIEGWYEAIRNLAEAEKNYASARRDNLDSIGDASPLAIQQTYKDEIKALQTVYDSYNKELTARIAQFNADVKSGLLTENTEEWREVKTQIEELNSAVLETADSIRTLKDELRERIYYKPYQDALDSADSFRSMIKDIQSLISDEMKYDDNGRFTEFGFANMASDIKQYQSGLNSLQTLMKRRQEIINQYTNNTTEYSQEEFEKDMKDVTSDIRSMLSSVDDYRRAVIADIIAQAKEELSVTNKLIDAEKERFQKQKEYNDYDRNLRNKTKEIQLLEQQRRALEGMTDAESRAAKARIDAQIAEKKEDLDNTVEDHVYEMRVEGLEDLKDQLQESFDEWSENLSGNLGDLTEALQSATEVVDNGLSTVNKAIDELLQSFGISGLVNEVAAIPNFQKSTVDLTNGKTITNLSNSTMDFYERLMSTNAASLTKAALSTTPKYTLATSNPATTNNITSNVTVGSLINVQGNLDPATGDNLVSAIQRSNLVDEVYNEIIQRMVSERRLSGH